jgi:uncharacterized protein involved in exopolysaccharide biosynthesis
MAEGHRAEIESLNLMLAQERAATRRQEGLFEEREEAWQTALSEREAENASLRAENKAVKGQRNAFLAIMIAAGAAAALSIAFKVLRV